MRCRIGVIGLACLTLVTEALAAAGGPGVGAPLPGEAPDFASRSEAVIFLLAVGLLVPFAMLIGGACLAFLGAIARGLVLPLAQALRLPDWTATSVVVATFAAGAYVGRGTWLPGSFWILDLIDSAWSALT